MIVVLEKSTLSTANGAPVLVVSYDGVHLAAVGNRRPHCASDRPRPTRRWAVYSGPVVIFPFGLGGGYLLFLAVRQVAPAAIGRIWE